MNFPLVVFLDIRPVQAQVIIMGPYNDALCFKFALITGNDAYNVSQYHFMLGISAF
jgi:hypothetical protein